MNCTLYCILSYEQVYRVRHCDTFQHLELLWLLSARTYIYTYVHIYTHTYIFPFDSVSGGGECLYMVCEREGDCHWQKRYLRAAWTLFSVFKIFLETIWPSLILSSCHVFSCTMAMPLVAILRWIPSPSILFFSSEKRCKKSNTGESCYKN